jgi:hypothetical protein
MDRSRKGKQVLVEMVDDDDNITMCELCQERMNESLLHVRSYRVTRVNRTNSSLQLFRLSFSPIKRPARRCLWSVATARNQ